MQVIAHLEPLQQRYNAIMEDDGYLDSVLAQGTGESRPKTSTYRLSLCDPVSSHISCEWQASLSHTNCSADKAEEAATRTLDNVREVSMTHPMHPHRQCATQSFPSSNSFRAAAHAQAMGFIPRVRR